MLYADAEAFALTVIILVLVVASMVALFFRDSSGGEVAKPYVLSEEARARLESLKLEVRRRAQIGRRQRNIKGPRTR